jgi:hypothetical protein
MIASPRRPLVMVMLVVGITFALAPDAAAQLKGHYVPGFTGLQNGSQGPPAITIALPLYFYTTDTLVDANGNTLGEHPRINSSFLGPALLWVTNVKVFGGNFGGQIAPAAWIKARIEGPSLDVPGSFNFTDIFVSPIQLGWEKPRADFVAAWGVFMPTGKWEFGGSDNGGLGMWSNDFQAGTTVRLDDKHAWSASSLATYEVHSKKHDSQLQVGDILTLEGGVGRSFYTKVDGSPIPRITTIGLAYYGQFKVSSDSGPLGTFGFETRKDRVFGIGGEANVFLPKSKLLIGLRVIPEFGAVNRTEGFTFMLTLGYQAKSLAKSP